MNGFYRNLLNTVTLFITVGINLWAGTVGISGKTVGDVSDRFQTLITPAAYTFSIWSLIYAGLILLVGYQWQEWYRNRRNSADMGLWFTVANVANTCWIVAWLMEWLGLSVLLIFLLLFSLLRIILMLNMERWDAPLRTIVFIWWPVTFYTGWLVVVSVTNVAAFLVSIGWNFEGDGWAILMIGITTGIFILLTINRNMRETCLVGIWAFIGIGVRQYAPRPSIFYFALFASLILFTVAALHAYRNRRTSPVRKWQRGEL